MRYKNRNEIQCGAKIFGHCHTHVHKGRVDAIDLEYINEIRVVMADGSCCGWFKPEDLEPRGRKERRRLRDLRSA